MKKSIMSRFYVLFAFFVLIGCNASQPEIAELSPVAATDVPTQVVEETPEPTRTPRPTWTTISTNTPQSDTPVPPTDLPATVTPLPTETATVAPTETVMPTVETATTVVESVATALPPTIAVATTVVPATSIPTTQPTATTVPSTATSVASTATPIPATATNMPPTATNVPATTTAEPPTATSLPPTATQIPATATPIPPTAVPTSSAMSIGSLASLPDGQEVTITGQVVNASSFSAGFKLTVADSTGRIALVMFHNTYDDCWDKNVLNVGATVVVEGEIGRFEGELQIVPQWGGGVNVTAPAYAYAPPQTVANLPNVIGQRAMIEGEITEVDVTDSFTKIDVNDGTGVVEVFLWNNIWVRVPNKDALAAGQRIKAVGVVGEFQGTLQLSPPLPYDVVQQ